MQNQVVGSFIAQAREVIRPLALLCEDASGKPVGVEGEAFAPWTVPDDGQPRRGIQRKLLLMLTSA